MATLTKQVDNLNKRVVALENSELEASDAVPFIVKLYADFEVSPVIECGEGGYSDEKLELIINGAVKEVTNRILNGDFNNGTTGWTSTAAALTFNSINNILSVTPLSTPSTYGFKNQTDRPLVVGDKIFIKLKIRTLGTTSSITVNLRGSSSGTVSVSFQSIPNPTPNTWYEIDAIANVTSSITGNLQIAIVVVTGNIIEIEGWNGETADAGVYVINLTEEFGADNEPTAAEMKAAIDEYRARVYPECSEDTELTPGAAGAAEELSEKINYSAVGTGIVPAPGTIGMPYEAARKPVGSVTTVENFETEAVIVFSSFFDEQAANGETLTSAAVLYDATDSIGTGAVVTSEAINIEKTSAKTLTVSAEITITEVV